jgi:hypothetical protein
MANCTIDRGSIRNGIVTTASKMLLQSGKFRQEEDRFIPTAENANEIANLVNEKFRDMLVRKQEGYYTLIPFFSSSRSL